MNSLQLSPNDTFPHDAWYDTIPRDAMETLCVELHVQPAANAVCGLQIGRFKREGPIGIVRRKIEEKWCDTCLLGQAPARHLRRAILSMLTSKLAEQQKSLLPLLT